MGIAMNGPFITPNLMYLKQAGAEQLNLGLSLTNESLSALAAAQFISSVFMMPLLMYGIAAVSHLILKYFGGQGDYIGARRALFWAALVTTPAILLTSIAEAYFSEISTILSVITTMIFVWQWVSNLKELEFNNV